MRLIALLALLLPSMALAQVTIGPGAHTGPRILGEVSTEYCPMLTHGKCTDSKTILTTRSTPVPCGSGTAGVDVGCYQGALQCQGQVTNYALNSTNFFVWSVTSGVTVTPLVGEPGVRVCLPAGTGRRGIFYPSTIGAAVAGDAATAAFDARVTDANVSRLYVYAGTGGSPSMQSCEIMPQQGGWSRAHCTSAVTSGATVRPYIYASADSGGCFDVRQAQWEKSSTPGRRCDAGATPATCDGDKHKRSSAGWPTTQGRITLRYAPQHATSADNRYLIDSRATTGVAAYVHATGRIEFRAHDGSGATLASSPLTWVGCDSSITTCHGYLLDFRWSAGRVEIRRDGVVVASSTAPNPVPTGHSPEVALGSTLTGILPANGTISRLEWSTQ